MTYSIEISEQAEMDLRNILNILLETCKHLKVRFPSLKGLKNASTPLTKCRIVIIFMIKSLGAPEACA